MKLVVRVLLGIVLLAILFCVAVPNFFESSVRSKPSRAKSDMRSYATVIASYFVDNNAYPPAVPMKSYIKTK